MSGMEDKRNTEMFEPIRDRENLFSSQHDIKNGAVDRLVLPLNTGQSIVDTPERAHLRVTVVFDFDFERHSDEGLVLND